MNDIIKRLSEIKPELEKKYGLSEIGLFGSYIRNEENENSDVDILVDFNRKITLFELADMEIFIKEKLNKNIDLALKRNLKPEIGKHILNEVKYL